MDLVQHQMQSIHGLAIHSPESNKSSRWTLMELVQQQMQSIHGLAIHIPESNKSSRWCLMDLVVHTAACSIHWAILWSTEPITIRQNQEKVFRFEVVIRKHCCFKRHLLLFALVSAHCPPSSILVSASAEITTSTRINPSGSRIPFIFCCLCSETFQSRKIINRLLSVHNITASLAYLIT